MKKNFRLISFLTALLVFLQFNSPYIALAQQFLITPSTSLVPLSGNVSTGTRDIRPFLDVHLQNLQPNPLKLSFEDLTGQWKGSAKTEFTKPADGIRDGAEPASYVTSYSYNADSLQTSVTFPRGNGVVNQYDSAMIGGTQDARAKGNLLKTIRVPDMAVVTNPEVYAPQTADITTAFTYENLFNQIDAITDPTITRDGP